MRYWILATAALATSAMAAEATPGWQIYQDPVATKGLVVAFVQSSDGSQLLLKCDKPGKNRVYAILVSPLQLAPPYNRDIKRQVKLRFDDNPPKDDSWRYREKTAKAVDAPGEHALGRFLEPLATAKQLQVILYPSDTHDPPITTQFDVHGASDAIGKVFDSCKDKNPLG